MSELGKKELAIREALETLNDAEVYAYNYWLEGKQPSLSASLNANLYQLYLNGKTCDEIRRLNPAIGLGQIVAARLQGQWDRRREEYLDELLEHTTMRVKQSTLEAASFICDMLAVANKEHGDKLRRYLQTGDERELGTFRINNMQSFKYAVEVMQKLTGQERQQQVTVSGTVEHTATVEETEEPGTSNSAASMLKQLLG